MHAAHQFHPVDDRDPSWAEKFDVDGFLLDASAWTSDLAKEIARADGLGELTEKHWEVIHHVRQKYISLGSLPVMRLICRAAGLDRHKAHMLFSSCQGMWRVAGLPHPGEEAKSYMD